MSASPLARKRIKRFAPVQLGKMLAILYGLVGLIFVPFFLIMSMTSAAAPAASSGTVAVGAGVALFIPLIYAAIGFVFGILGAGLYNLVARWIGGIEIEIELQ